MSSAPKLDANTAGAWRAAIVAQQRHRIVDTRPEIRIIALRRRRGAAAKPRLRRARGRRVDAREVLETRKCVGRIAVGANDERIETALGQREQLVAQYVADGAQLAREAEAVAQKPRDRVATAVGELRKVDGDHRQRRDVVRDRRRIVGRREPHADVAAGEEGAPLRKPQRERDDRRRSGRHVGERRRLAQERVAIGRRARGP